MTNCNDVKEYGLSIIIPVYNVENYIDQCLFSCIINQRTQYNYEVVIVDDGSTDNSGIIAQRWCKKGKNVKLIHQDNQGLGAARNTGVRHAEMPYVTFVDSDDWISEDFVECMMHHVQSGDYDLVYCDAFIYNSENGMISRDSFRKNLQLINADYSQRMFFGYPNMWGAVYERSKFAELSIPNVVYEDTAFYGVILDVFHKIGCCGKELYYYRSGRKGSLMNLNYTKTDVMINALTVLLNESDKRGIFIKHWIAFLDFTIRQLQGEWIIATKNDKAHEAKKEICKFLNEYYPGWEFQYMQRCAALGSSNACMIYNRVKMFREKIGDKYHFFSFISFLSEPLPREKLFINPNASSYRIAMLEKQIKGDLYLQLENNDTIIFDLFEELHDIINIDNCYINKTDAFDSTINLLDDYEVIKYDSEERYLLWEKSISIFSKWAIENNKTIILLQYFLCEESGDAFTKRNYDNLELIKKKNKILARYYEFIKLECKEFRIVTLPDVFHYTDEKYVFGRSPEYFNKYAYFILSYKTMTCWRKNENE